MKTSRLSAAFGVTAICLGLASCVSDGGGGSGDPDAGQPDAVVDAGGDGAEDGGPSPGDGADAPIYLPAPPLSPSLMYSLAMIPEFHLELDEAAVASLWEEPKTWVPARFRYGQETFYPVAVRLKGSATLATLDEKPSLKVNFNKYIKGQKFAGREGLMLHSMVSDASMVREHLAYAIFRAAGVPGPRTGYARLSINGVSYGVYLNVEPYDDDYLEDRFADPKGNLYEGASGDDVDGNIWQYDQDEGADLSRDDLGALKSAALVPGESIFFAPDTSLDTDEFMRYVAVEGLLGHYEGYQGPHNYYLYHEVEADRWVFLPWNTDQTLRRKTSAFAGEGYLTRKCIDDLDLCRLQFITTAQAVGDDVLALDPQGVVDDAIALFHDAALADDRKAWTNAQMASEQKAVRSRIHAWLNDFRAEVDCLVGGQEPDVDDDGYGSCYHDCHDGDPTINPAAGEPCDGFDNDCTGYVDDVPACPCPSTEIDGKEFFFCTHVRTWKQGRTFCEAQGHELARFDSVEQNIGAWGFAKGEGAGPWAIGLNDIRSEDTYEWTNGSAPTFPIPWSDGEPAHTLPWYDCVFYTGGSQPNWRERNCIQQGVFICSETAD